MSNCTFAGSVLSVPAFTKRIFCHSHLQDVTWGTCGTNLEQHSNILMFSKFNCNFRNEYSQIYVKSVTDDKL